MLDHPNVIKLYEYYEGATPPPPRPCLSPEVWLRVEQRPAAAYAVSKCRVFAHCCLMGCSAATDRDQSSLHYSLSSSPSKAAAVFSPLPLRRRAKHLPHPRVLRRRRAVRSAAPAEGQPVRRGSRVFRTRAPAASRSAVVSALRRLAVRVLPSAAATRRRRRRASCSRCLPPSATRTSASIRAASAAAMASSCAASRGRLRTRVFFGR
jgi:hypothetical protein